MEPFVYHAQSQRVVFGSGTLSVIGDEMAGLGLSRALVLSTPQQEAGATALAAQLGDKRAGVFARATMHTPVEVTEEAMLVVKASRADCVIALGGGSTIGLGKAIALRTDLPQIVIPTSYAGSEATPILGETKDGGKTTQRSPKILPEVIVYDVDLTLTLPVSMSITSGMNAVAHAVEALYTQERNPIISLFAQQGIDAITRALPAIVRDLHNVEARSDALFGAWACGTCLGAVGMALHHKICHALGGSFDLPHAETHTVVLPHAIAYNEVAARDLLKPVASMLNAGSAAQGLWDLEKRLGAPLTLQEIGMPAEGLDRAADIINSNPYWNPRPVERAGIRQLLDDAYHGRRPG